MSPSHPLTHQQCIMNRTAATQKYGKRSTRTKGDRLFAELPQSPLRKKQADDGDAKDGIHAVTEGLSAISMNDKDEPSQLPSPRRSPRRKTTAAASTRDASPLPSRAKAKEDKQVPDERPQLGHTEELRDDTLRTLTWNDVCPPGDRIVKIAEASYAEVYRVSNERGTSIIKVMRLESPIKAQTKTQERARLVDETPRSDAEIQGELRISEWLADIPGFVMYKERYTVQGKTTKGLLETHQAFQRRLKRQDPGRAQFYPSPSRYLDGTTFLVVELGDAGTALEDWKLTTESELWDIFLLEAIALARAEDLAMFEHRDLHEGNVCVRQVSPPKDPPPAETGGPRFGYSGLDITILDYGLSRAEDLSIDMARPVAYDLERDLSLFTSDHAPQCRVYRQMRSFLMRADRRCLPPEEHDTPYPPGADGNPLSWEAYAPYTNVLWLAYLYRYMVDNFQGDRKHLARFVRETRRMWRFLNPDAPDDTLCFECAADVVCYAVESGWVREDQLTEGESMLAREDSIIQAREEEDARRRTHGV